MCFPRNLWIVLVQVFCRTLLSDFLLIAFLNLFKNCSVIKYGIHKQLFLILLVNSCSILFLIKDSNAGYDFVLSCFKLWKKGEYKVLYLRLFSMHISFDLRDTLNRYSAKVAKNLAFQHSFKEHSTIRAIFCKFCTLF